MTSSTIKKNASNAHIWTRCEGYIHQANDYLRRYGAMPSPSTDEGRLAHTVAERALKRRLEDGDTSIDNKIDDVVVPVDMRLKVEGYVEFCNEVYNLESPALTWVEHKFSCPFLDDEQCTRVDFAAYHPDRRHLAIVDLKYGHRNVTAKNNPQLLIGAQALIEYLSLRGSPVDNVSMVIYQPNGPMASIPVDEWQQSAMGVQIATEFIKKCYDSDGGKLSPGSYCHYCNARGGCDAVTLALYESWDVMTTYNEIPREFTVDELERMMAEAEAIKDLLRAHQTGLEQMVISRLKGGEQFPKWEYSSSLSDRKWDYEAKDIIDVGKSLGIDLERHTLLSPKQAEMAGMPKEVVNAFVRRDSTGMKLRKKSLKTLKQAFE